MPTLLPFANRTPYPAEMIRTRCKDNARKYANRPALPANWKATTTGVLQLACYYGAEARHSILMYLFGVTSSSGLTNGAWWALYSWVMPHPMGDDCGDWCRNKTDTWHHHPALSQEIKNILDARLIEQGQSRMFDDTMGGYWEDPAELKQREW